MLQVGQISFFSVRLREASRLRGYRVSGNSPPGEQWLGPGLCINGTVYFELETLHHMNVQACSEWAKAEEKQRGDEHLNTIYRWLPFLPTKNSLPNLEAWKWRRVREGVMPVTGCTPRERWESHRHSCEEWIMSFHQVLPQTFRETCQWGYNRDDCPFW